MNSTFLDKDGSPAKARLPFLYLWVNFSFMSSTLPIGFFDSGVGGLTVLHEAMHLLPHEHYLYFADSEHAPYGIRSKEDVRRLVLDAVEFMAGQGMKALVVACNTGTSAAIEALRERYPFPVIGMEPAVKPAVTGQQKRVLVFATELTLREEKFKNLVARVDTAGLVDYLPLQELVRYAENFEFDEAVIRPYLESKLAGLQLSDYGTAVLGCTHFLFFKPILQKVLPGVEIIDGNVGTINNLRKQLGGNLNDSGDGQVEYFVSGKKAEAAGFERYMEKLGDRRQGSGDRKQEAGIRP